MKKRFSMILAFLCFILFQLMILQGDKKSAYAAADGEYKIEGDTVKVYDAFCYIPDTEAEKKELDNVKHIELYTTGIDISELTIFKNAETLYLSSEVSFFLVENRRARDLYSLKEVQVDKENQWYTSKDGALYNKSGEVLVYFPVNGTKDSLILPEGVVSFGEAAFRNVKVKEITLPASFYNIETDVFAKSTIEAFHVAKENKFLASYDGAIYNKAMTYLYYWPEQKVMENLTFPDTLAFLDCSKIATFSSVKTITIPKAMTAIANTGNNKLSEIKLDDKNTTFHLRDDVLYSSNNLYVRLFPNKNKAAKINTITTNDKKKYFDPHKNAKDFKNATSIVISKDADFSSWNTSDVFPKVKTVSFEEGTKELEYYFFYYFPNLEKIELPMSMESVDKVFREDEFFDIYEYEYDHLNKLQAFEVNPENTHFTSVDGALYTKDQKELICYPCDNPEDMYVMPQFTETMRYQAFQTSSHLHTIIIGPRLKEYYNFSLSVGYFPNLQNFEVSNGNMYYQEYDGILFNETGTIVLKYPDGKSTDYYKIPDTVTTIRGGAFSDCSIEIIEISSQLHESDISNLKNCHTLSFIVPDTNEELTCEDGIVYNKNKERLVCWPKDKVVTEVKLPSTVQELDINNIGCLEEVTKITIPRDLKEIVTSTGPTDSKVKLVSLCTIDVEEGNSSFTVVDGILYGDNQRVIVLTPAKLKNTKITVPASFEFGGLRNSSMKFPSVKKIVLNGNAIGFPFECFPNATTIEVAKTNKEVKLVDQVLYSADKKTLIWYMPSKKNTSFTIPSSVTVIKDDAFTGAKNLQTVTLPKNLKKNTYKVQWFNDCKKLKQIKVASGCKYYKAVDGVLYTKDMKTLLYYPIAKTSKSFSIPDSVVNYNSETQNSYLTTIKIGANLKKAMGYKIYPKLTTIKVSSKNKTYFVKDNVLYQKYYGEKCISLYPLGKKNTSFVIPEDVDNIFGSVMFVENPYLKVLTSKSVKYDTFAKHVSCFYYVFGE